ncbi:MAG: type III glutamate--ammonia ligase, partial [Pseudomonadota bacterium]|nr:type III glutamate--ammonia ligase [Pseudomonadota bacterium]
RTHMVRIPDPGRFELRLADGAANPYLLAAGVLAAGLAGVATEADPGQRLDIDMYSAGPLEGVTKLPAYLIDALRLLDGSAGLRAAMGDEFIDAYVTIKQREWDDYARQITEWERAATLDL